MDLTGQLSEDGPRPRRSVQFSLASLLLITFVVSVCLAAARVDLQLGLLFAFLTIPALLRTAVVANRKTREGYALNSRGWIMEFLFSWAITFPVTIAALYAAMIVALLLFLADEIISLPGELFMGSILGVVAIVFYFGIRGSLQYGPAKETEAFSRRLPRYLPAPLLAQASCYPRPMLYTPAMIAELARVPVASVRAWQRRGWLVPREVEHGLARFDFAQVTIARTLAGLLQAGIKPAALAKRLSEIAVHLPHVEQPLVELTFLVDGGQLLVRHGEDILEPRGQLRMDFDSLAADESAEPAILSPPLTAEVLASGARELEEAGNLAAAADLYRAALAEAGPRGDLCFDLAETLYRLGDLPAARERYFMAIELDEDHAEARANLGCLLAEMGQRDLATAALEGAIACHAEYADAHFHLARLLDEEGRDEDAEEHWRAFLKLAPDSPWHEEARARMGEE